MKRYISASRVEGNASRQAHCDLPEGTYEREMSKEGFFGPAAFFYHRHPPTGWSDFSGPLRAGATFEELKARITQLWQKRGDRYSELRSETRGPRRLEMSYIGG